MVHSLTIGHVELIFFNVCNISSSKRLLNILEHTYLLSIIVFFLQEITPNQLQEGRLYGVPLDSFVVTFMSYSYRTCAIFFFD